MRCVWIETGIQMSMEREADDKWLNETGGALIGYSDDRGWVVTHVIGPGPNAVHLPFLFSPDHEWQESQIADIYEQSGRLYTYLGDWHSHPQGENITSSKDRSTLRVIAKKSRPTIKNPLMIILDQGPTWELGAWTAERKWGLWEYRPLELCIQHR